MKTILKLSFVVVAFFSLFAAADEIDVLQGQYILKTSTQGTCYPQITVRREAFSNQPGIGIYGSEPGQIVFQMVGVNMGQLKTPQVNPMTSQIQGYIVSMSVVNLWKISGSSYRTDASGTMLSSTMIAGSFDQDTLSFSVRTVDDNVDPGLANVACVYTKKH